MAAKFIRKLSAFSLLLLLTAGIFLYLPRLNLERMNLSNSDSSVKYLMLQKAKKYDYLVMGSSRAERLSKFGTHDKVEKILGGSMVNLAHDGATVVPMRVFNDTFYDMGNQADLTIYLIEPWVLYSRYYNDHMAYYYAEPFWPTLLRNIYKHVRLSIYQIAEELRLKVAYRIYLQRYERFSQPNTLSLEKRDEVAFEKTMSSLYPDGLDEDMFKRCSNHLKEIAKQSMTDGDMIFIRTPNLATHEEGTEELIELLEEIKLTTGVQYYDLTKSVTNVGYFDDVHHLNTEGALYFAEHHLKPLIDEHRRTKNQLENESNF